MDQHHTSVEILNNGYKDNFQEGLYNQLPLLSDSNDSQGSQEHRGSRDTSVSLGSEGNRRKSCPRAICKVVLCFTLVLFVVAGSFVVGLFVGHNSWKKEPAPFAAENSLLTASNMQEDIKYNIDVKGSSCNGGDCKRCKRTINAPVQAVNDHDGNDCSNAASHTGYRNCSANASLNCIGQCLQCHDTCRNYSSMVQYLDQNSPCADHEEKIMCCTLLHMRPGDYCLNGGKLICEGQKSEPYCTCPEGWTGSRCDSRIIENVTCKCFKTDNSFCGENDMYNCTDDHRPKDWTECRQNIEGTTWSRCVCEKSAEDLSTTSLPKCEEISTEYSVEIARPPSAHGTENGAEMSSNSIAITFTFPVTLICSKVFQSMSFI